jgi:hypothetical protein
MFKGESDQDMYVRVERHGGVGGVRRNGYSHMSLVSCKFLSHYKPASLIQHCAKDLRVPALPLQAFDDEYHRAQGACCFDDTLGDLYQLGLAHDRMEADEVEWPHHHKKMFEDHGLTYTHPRRPTEQDLADNPVYWTQIPRIRSVIDFWHALEKPQSPEKDVLIDTSQTLGRNQNAIGILPCSHTNSFIYSLYHKKFKSVTEMMRIHFLDPSWFAVSNTTAPILRNMVGNCWVNTVMTAFLMSVLTHMPNEVLIPGMDPDLDYEILRMMPRIPQNPQEEHEQEFKKRLLKVQDMLN